MSSFTKGEWKAEINWLETEDHKQTMKAFIPDYEGPDSWGVQNYRNGGSTFIASTGCFDDSEANAHLIAAAPELYEALEDVCKQMEYMATWDKHGQSYYKAKRALSKARGEQ